jgi:hypothetical protein
LCHPLCTNFTKIQRLQNFNAHNFKKVPKTIRAATSELNHQQKEKPNLLLPLSLECDYRLGANQINFYYAGPDRTRIKNPASRTGPDRTGYRIYTMILGPTRFYRISDNCCECDIEHRENFSRVIKSDDSRWSPRSKKLRRLCSK